MTERSATDQGGFTLIEILIVISIISTLSLIGLSSSRRAINKAKNASKISAIDSISKSFTAYVIDNGTLPAPLETVRSGFGSFVGCVGKTTQNVNANALTDCDLTIAPYEENAALNSAIVTVNKTLPSTDDTGVSFGASGSFWGATLVYFDSSNTTRLNGVQRRMWLNYALHGSNQTCESFGGEVVNGGTPPNWTSTSPTNKGIQSNGNTICYVALTREFGR